MNYNQFKSIWKKDLLIHASIYLCLFIILKIIFFKETFFNIIKILSALYFLLIIPGFIIMYLFNLPFLERLFIGIAVGSAIIGILAYYLNMTGINFKYLIILPLLTMIISGILLFLKWRKHHD